MVPTADNLPRSEVKWPTHCAYCDTKLDQFWIDEHKRHPLYATDGRPMPLCRTCQYALRKGRDDLKDRERVKQKVTGSSCMHPLNPMNQRALNLVLLIGPRPVIKDAD